MAEGTDKPAPRQEREARKRTQRSVSHARTRRSRAWTRRELDGKVVWDWLQLPVVPFALAIIGFSLTMQQDKRQQRIENQMAASDRAIGEQRAEQATPQTYLDRMGMLLLAPVEFSAY
jgi:hypothetical protein